MSDQPINLNRIRKTRARDDARKHADENAIKFGRTKAERLLDATRNAKARIMLDQHKMDDEA